VLTARRDAAVGVLLLILAVLYWLGASTIRVSLLEGGVGAGALPRILAATLAFLALVLVAQSLWRARTAAPAEDDGKAIDVRRHLRAGGLLLIGVGYVLLVETVGYLPSIAYLLAAVVLFVGGASRRTIVLFAVLGAIFFWVFFVEVLGIRQPNGFWPLLWHKVAGIEHQVAARVPDSAGL